MSGEPVLYSLYVYAPNKVAPIIFAIAFAISSVGHIWQCSRYRSWRVIGLQPLCTVLYTAGYVLREYGAFHYLYSVTNLIIFVVSQVMIYVCPPLLELANYHVLARILYYVPYCAPFPPAQVMSLFGFLVFIVEALNGVGIALSSNVSSSGSTQQLGSSLTKATIALQFCVIVACVTIAGLFYRRCVKADIHNRNVSTPLTTLCISMFLILIRCIYRLVEHTGNVGLKIDDIDSLRRLTPLLRHEWYFYVFESTIMLLNSLLWNIWNPGRYLPRRHNVYLSSDARTEVETEVEADTRTLLEKTGSVLTWGVFFRPKRHARQQDYEIGDWNGCLREH